MKLINVHSAKTNFSKLLGNVEAGETILICRNGKPVAELIPHKPRNRLKPHPRLRQVTINYDPTEALTPEEWRMEG